MKESDYAPTTQQTIFPGMKTEKNSWGLIGKKDTRADGGTGVLFYAP